MSWTEQAQEFDAVVVGAGWAGVAVSRALQGEGIRHVVLERHRICETWRSQRWDSFRMNTPNVHTVMPGDTYGGGDPEGFMTRDAFVAMVADHARRHALPVITDAPVEVVRPDGKGSFEVRSPAGVWRARHIVAATGNLNLPRRPSFARRVPDTVRQMDGSAYRHAGQPGPGAVLVVGCGNSGGQIAEDLALGGREVYLATGRNGRVPRRYRGRDISLWLAATGRYDRPRTAATGRPLLGATHTISLQSLSAQGVRMLGRLIDVTDAGLLHFADDLLDNARFGDRVSAELKAEVDAYVAAEGFEAPAALPEPAETVTARFPVPAVLSLDPLTAGIGTLIWCVGFEGDFAWMQVPGAVDAVGRPAQDRCLSVPGVYYAGLDNASALKAGTILAAADEAARIAQHVAESLRSG